MALHEKVSPFSLSSFSYERKEMYKISDKIAHTHTHIRQWEPFSHFTRVYAAINNECMNQSEEHEKGNCWQ